MPPGVMRTLQRRDRSAPSWLPAIHAIPLAVLVGRQENIAIHLRMRRRFTGEVSRVSARSIRMAQESRPASMSARTNALSLSRHATSLASARSVSYTHLRAHETRHDLVCRLLLEK